MVATSLFGQSPDPTATGKISGRVVDSATGQPIQFATLSLNIMPTNSVVNGASADEKGSFTITNVANGTYKLLIAFIGYKTTAVDNITISKDKPTVALGNIKVPGEQKILNKVTIVGQKALIENQIDKMVYNVDQDVTSKTGVAADILQKIPQVSVDVDGNVELQGNSDIQFLIDGKPSAVYGNNITEVLQSIPASQIEKIEVITSPGAKYDASGTGGIINIVLKKSTAEGINGNLSLTGGTRLENGSFNLNIHHGHFGVNFFVSGNGQLPSTTLNTLNSTSNVGSESTILDENGTSIFNRQGVQSGLGFDWDINKKNNLNGNVSYNYYGNKYSTTTNRTNTVDSAGNQLSTLNDQLQSPSNFYSSTITGQLGYKKKFNTEGQELDVSAVASYDNNYLHYQQTQNYIIPDNIYAGSYGNNPGVDKEGTFSIDYTQPFGDKFTLETGGRLSISQISSNSDVYEFNAPNNDFSYSNSQSLTLNYQSNIYAGYVSGKFKLFNWLDAIAGFRYEYTDISQSYYSNVGNVDIPSYGSYVPSATIAHTFNGAQTLKLSYGRRIERPDYRSLNPFVNASDPKNLTAGNPLLAPEIGDKLELSYNKTFDKGANVNVTLFWRGNKDDIQPYTTYYSSFMVGDTTYNDVYVTTRQNVGHEENFGANISGSVTLAKKVTLRTNVSLFQRYIYTGDLAGDNIQGFNYRITANGSYEINKDFVIELFGNFNSPRLNIQGTQPGFITYNIALRKQFFDKKFSLALTATNPFSEYVNQATTLTGVNFTSYNLRELPYRSFGINLTYKFGKMTFKKEKEPDDQNLTNPPMDQ
jgi:outer membrane receptor protein involved in Fe transport